MKQKLFTLLLAVAASVGIMFASDTQVNGIWYIFDSSNHTASVTYKGNVITNIRQDYTGSIVVIPGSVIYNNITYSVTSIGDWAFSCCSSLTSVTIPNSVTSIGAGAFADCSGLTSVTIPNSVTSIGGSAFRNCTGLTSVTISNSVTSIGEEAFRGCSGLTSVTIPNNVTSIGSSAFSGCSGLTSITIPNNVTSIGSSAFSGCSGLTSVTIGNSVTSIGYAAFRYCSSLTSLTIPNSVTNIGEYAFRGCSGLTSVTIGNSVTSIGSSAFESCNSLTSVVWNTKNCSNSGNFGSQVESFVFGNEVDTIPAYCCSGMKKLKSITIPNSVTSIGGNAFSGCSGLTKVNITDIAAWCNIAFDGNTSNPLNNAKHLFVNDVEVTDLVIPNSVASIGRYAFYNCSGLTSVTIPNSVTSIGWGAFYNCYRLTSVDIPNSVTSIGEGAFFNCNNLTSITIPNSVTSIGGYAFSGCTGLTSITIPNSVTSIGESAFRNIANVIYEGEATGTPWEALYMNGYTDGYLTYADNTMTELVTCCRGANGEVEIPGSVTIIRQNAFSGCNRLTSVTIGNSVTSIGENAFWGCDNITSVIWNAQNCNSWNFGSQVTSFTFGNEVEILPASICSGMNKLTSITIPNNVTSIGDNAFSGCNNIKNVTLNSNAIASKNYDFSANLTTIFGTQVEEYIIGEAVTAIGSYAMYNASSLQAFTLPSSILSIGQRAFDGCSQLKQVAINSNAVMSKAYSPSNNFSTIFGAQVQTYNLGDAITAIGDYAFSGCKNITTLTLPNNVAQVGNGTFQGCTGITSFAIPQTVTTIGDYAFSTCTGIQTLNIPNATSIGKGAFADCSNLTAVQLGNGLISLGDSAFSSCYNLQAITFPSSLKTIGNYAFYQCNRFTTIDIPGSVASLGEGAFKGCTKLTSVSINSNAVMSKAYSSTSNLSTIFGSQVQSFTLSDAITAIGDYAFYKYTSLPAITIPDNVTTIGSSAFYGCTGLKSMVIPERVTGIEESTFSGCTALASVQLPNTITSIKDSAFFNCSSLQLESLPSAVSTLGKGAFSGCGSLASIAMPASLTSVGENAFNDCSGIAEVKIENVDSWCKIDFANSKSNPVFYSRNLYVGDSLIAELTIPNKITELKPWTFVNCNSINSVFIPNTVRLFSPNAFYDCENITSIEWHAKNIADYASSDASPFYASRSKITSFVFGEETEHIPSHLCNGMSKINLLSFPSYLKSIGDYSFKDLTKIRKINIPNEVTSIGAHAFDSCILVTSIYLGYQVEDIGDYAFKGCIRVNDITCMNTVTPVVYDNTLSSISDYAYLYVPAGSKRTYQLDPYWGRFDIREIASEEATLTKGSVTVEANDDNAIFTWPTDSAAASYSLQITKDEVVFCTLVFNSNGQLTGIAFAPGRNGAAHAPAATMSVAGMSFTVTGLNVASKYAYRLVVADDASEELVAYSGEFATTGYAGEVNPGGEPETAVNDITNDAQPTTKLFRNGQLFILRGDKTYTIQGQEVR